MTSITVLLYRAGSVVTTGIRAPAATAAACNAGQLKPGCSARNWATSAVQNVAAHAAAEAR
jgi:hypothetical protein